MRYLILLLLAGCSYSQPPEYFLRNVGHVEYVVKVEHKKDSVFFPVLGFTKIDDGSMQIKRNALFVSDEEILLHEQAHSFELIARKHRYVEWKRFRRDFGYNWGVGWGKPWEDFPPVVLRILRRGVKNEKDEIAWKFIAGGYK